VVLENTFAASEVLEQLERILANGEFAQSERMSRFLRLAVEYSLEKRGAELKEYLIATEVFDRKPSFDSRLDPIVRVEARRLRSKLLKYYEGEGSEDEIVIELPKGSYAAVFSPRRQASHAAPSRAAHAPAGGAIVVLPFVNLSAEEENEYFSDGLTQELILKLTRVEGLRVVAWNSAAQLRGASHDIPAIGRQLNVGAVLTGSVRRAGNRVRIAVQLIETATNLYLWSEAYDRELDDLLQLQDEISRAIASTLRIKLADRLSLPAPHTAVRNFEAHNLYLKGRFHWNKRTGEGLRRSVQYFERALALDETSALGWAGLADAYSLLADYGQVPPAEAMPRAKQAAEKAIALDPSMGEAWTSLALIRSSYEWDWEGSEMCYRRAIELNPGYATAHLWYGADFLAVRGRFEEARRECELARHFDPLSNIIMETDGFLHLMMRRYDEAIDAYREVVDLDANYYKGWASIGRALIQKGQYREAIGMLEKARSLGGDIPSVLGALGQAYALAGRRDWARALLEKLNTAAKTSYITSSCFAIIHIGLEETEQALAALEAGCERRDLPLLNLNVHPVYDSLRGEPRFTALLCRMKLVT
jgi:TolB-like protein/Tfp pilus assembly protein PilF